MTTGRRRGALALVVASGLLACGLALGALAPESFGPVGALAVADPLLGDTTRQASGAAIGDLDAARAERDPALAWLARGLLALAVAWLAIGMLAARTRLVRRPGAAAARASWLASTRPWRARESTLGMLELDRWLLLGVPAALLVATRAVQTSFLSWFHLAVVLAAWAAFAVAVRICVGRRSPWPVVAAVGGVVVLRCIVALAAMSFAGPGAQWSAVTTDPAARTTYLAIALPLAVWVLVAAAWALWAQFGPRRAVGFVLAGAGAALAVPAAILGAVGSATMLDRWNGDVGLLPWGLARLLGFPASAGAPAPWIAAALGLLLLGVGVLLGRPSRREDAASRG